MHQESLTPLTTKSLFQGHYPQPGSLYSVPQAATYFGTIEAMTKDDQISASLQLRKSKALEKPMKWEGDKEAIAFLTEALAELTLNQDFTDALSVIELGFNPLELDWIKAEKHYLIKRIECRDPAQFRIGENGQLLYSSLQFDWQPVPEHKVALFTRGATRQKPYGQSALEPCYPHWLGKWKVSNQLDTLGDKYNVPPTIAICDADDQTDLDNISGQMANLGNSDAIAVSGVKSIHELTVTGKASELLARIEKFDTSISKILTGQTLAMDTGKTGSYALGGVHENSLDAIAIVDLKQMLHKFNRTIFRWLLINNNKAHLQARLIFDEKTYKKQKEGNETQDDSEPFTLSNPGDPDMSLQLVL